MIAGFDDDLAGESTRISNRRVHPSLDRVLGPRIQHPAVPELLDQFGSPPVGKRVGHQESSCCRRLQRRGGKGALDQGLAAFPTDMALDGLAT